MGNKWSDQCFRPASGKAKAWPSAAWLQDADSSLVCYTAWHMLCAYFSHQWWAVKLLPLALLFEYCRVVCMFIHFCAVKLFSQDIVLRLEHIVTFPSIPVYMPIPVSWAWLLPSIFTLTAYWHIALLSRVWWFYECDSAKNKISYLHLDCSS